MCIVGPFVKNWLGIGAWTYMWVFVMTNLGCQLKSTKTQVARHPMRNFSCLIRLRYGDLPEIWIIWGGNTCPKSLAHLMMAASIKIYGRMKILVFAFCLHCFSQVHLFCCWSIPSLISEPSSLGFQCILKTSLINWAATEFLNFQLIDSHCWTSRTHSL